MSSSSGLNPKYSLSNILYQPAINCKFYETHEIADFLSEVAEVFKVKLLVCISQYNDTLLSSGCLVLINGKVHRFNKEEFLANWKSMKDYLDVQEKVDFREQIDSSKIFKNISGICQPVPEKLYIQPLVILVRDHPINLGYLLCSEQSPQEKRFRKVFDVLQIMLKLSVHTHACEENIRRDTISKIRKKVDAGQLPKPIPASKHSSTASALSDVLAISAHYTQSDAGSVYLRDKKDTLKLAYYTGAHKPPMDFPTKKRPRNVIRHCFENNRSFLTNDVDKIGETYSNIFYLDAFQDRSPEDKISELALPLYYASRTQDEVIGILNLEKKNGIFSRQDVDTIRKEIIDRLLSVDELDRQINSVFALLETVKEGANKKPSKHISPFFRSLTLINDALNGTIHNTPAFSGTIREYDPKAETLKRVLTVGEPYAKERPHEHIRITQYRTSVDANAFVHGEERYIANVFVYKKDKEKKYKSLDSPLVYRPNMISEYCIPLFDRNRVVGTFNVESNVRDAFVSHKGYLRTIAKLIEISIQLEQQKVEEETFREKTRTYYSLHDLLKEVPEFRHDFKKTYTTPNVTPLFWENLEVIRKKLLSLSDYYKKPHPLFKNTRRRTLTQIIRFLIRRHGIKETAITTFLGDYVLSSRAGRNLSLALDNILSNAQKAALSSPIHITTNRIRLRHNNMVRISVGCKALLSLSRQELAKMYHFPVDTPSGLRLGAFVAGCLIREISGLVYMTDHILTEPFAKTVVEVPYEKKVAGE